MSAKFQSGWESLNTDLETLQDFLMKYLLQYCTASECRKSLDDYFPMSEQDVILQDLVYEFINHVWHGSLVRCNQWGISYPILPSLLDPVIKVGWDMPVSKVISAGLTSKANYKGYYMRKQYLQRRLVLRTKQVHKGQFFDNTFNPKIPAINTKPLILNYKRQLCLSLPWGKISTKCDVSVLWKGIKCKHVFRKTDQHIKG